MQSEIIRFAKHIWRNSQKKSKKIYYNTDSVINARKVSEIKQEDMV